MEGYGETKYVKNVSANAPANVSANASTNVSANAPANVSANAPANANVSANTPANNASVGGTRKNQSGGKMPAVGTKAQVYHGTAKHTSGGLTRKDLIKTKKGRIVSRRKHAAGKKALKRLVKAGYKAKKGTFKLFKK
jgi:hypothetical protein